ncbi:hypothetical protein CRU99_08225 [Malaciobacter mytili]|uniref:hypothetical protein n=1 Tax=Malaciobacter mytili TaxID=603050 RepID=UPI00100BD7B4|nr:hypothetical protein [Malaciobacter mytili]RXI43281.1 hypothetical protein CRU99_08225 [Malaciobacter mytili]
MKNLEVLKNSDFILTFGIFLSNTNKEIFQAIQEAKENNSANIVYMHAVDTLSLKDFYTQFIKYEAGSEEGVSALLLDTFVKNSNNNIQEYIDELDIGYISAESSAGEEEFEEILELSQEKRNKVLIVGEDIFNHKRAKNILKILALIEKYSDFKIISTKQISLEDEELEEVEELLPFNGTVIYSYIDKEQDEDIVYGSASFARIAKIEDESEILIKSGEGETKKKFKISPSLQSTIAICATIENKDFLSVGYNYKPVKIERL